MKKLVKILGLLLVAGALFVGCKQEANIETDKVELSNGTWDLVQKGTATVSEDGYSVSISENYNVTFKVADKLVTFTKGSYGMSMTWGFGSSEEAAALKPTIEKMFGGEEGVTVTASGSNVIVSASEDFDEEEIADMNKGELKASDFIDSYITDEAVIKTNKKKTEYLITWKEKDKNPLGSDEIDVNYSITIKKQK